MKILKELKTFFWNRGPQFCFWQGWLFYFALLTWVCLILYRMQFATTYRYTNVSCEWRTSKVQFGQWMRWNFTSVDHSVVLRGMCGQKSAHIKKTNKMSTLTSLSIVAILSGKSCQISLLHSFKYLLHFSLSSLSCGATCRGVHLYSFIIIIIYFCYLYLNGHYYHCSSSVPVVS